jgi:hypothetical protein
MPVGYVTDRARESDENGSLGYGFDRSDSIGYGIAFVEIGEGLHWEQVKAASLAREREKELRLQLREVTELGRTPPTPFPYERRGGFYVYPPEVLEAVAVASRDFQARINTWLQATPRGSLPAARSIA